MAAAQTSAAAVSTALGSLPSGPDWGLRHTTALTYLVVLVEGGPRAQAQLKLGPGVLGSEPASASWSQARAFFLLPPGRISPGKGSVTRNLEGDQNPGVPAHGAISSGPLLSRSQESWLPALTLQPRSQGFQCLPHSDPGIRAPPLASVPFLPAPGLKCQPLSGAMVEAQTGAASPPSPAQSVWDRQG